MSDASFGALDLLRYTHWGQARDGAPNLGTDRRYTGMTWDAAVGWYWYQSRAYDPVLGRFLQPDTVVPNAGNPQSLNRYTYAGNNPLRYSDPIGHDKEDDDAGHR